MTEEEIAWLAEPRSVQNERMRKLIEAQSETITISRQYLDHLLNCLANQKYLHEMNTESLKEVREENQRIIDEAWNDGMHLLYHNQQAQAMAPMMGQQQPVPGQPPMQQGQAPGQLAGTQQPASGGQK